MLCFYFKHMSLFTLNILEHRYIRTETLLIFSTQAYVVFRMLNFRIWRDNIYHTRRCIYFSGKWTRKLEPIDEVVSFIFHRRFSVCLVCYGFRYFPLRVENSGKVLVHILFYTYACIHIIFVIHLCHN